MLWRVAHSQDRPDERRAHATLSRTPPTSTPRARVHGKVEIGEGASLWPYTVIRAEGSYVRLGRFTNLQDHVMVHVGYDKPTVVGDYCSITHRVVLHGCTIGDNCLIGIGATVMEGAVIGENSIVAGHSFRRRQHDHPAQLDRDGHARQGGAHEGTASSPTSSTPCSTTATRSATPGATTAAGTGPSTRPRWPRGRPRSSARRRQGAPEGPKEERQ